jgi:hypothetical protein
VILLDSTTSLLELVTAGTQVIHVNASWVDMSGATVTPAVPPQNTIINSATTTTIVGSPASTYSRAIKSVHIQNTDSTNSDTITVEHYDGTSTVTIKKLTLQAGYSYNYEDKRGWYIADPNGNEVVDNTNVHGLWLKTTVVLNGTTSFTTQASTATIHARLLAGGGAGGGSPATTGENGSGGSSGGYAEWAVAVAGNTAYTCAVGAGGTGVSAAAGNAGGNTTLTVGGTTCTANGGLGGNVGVATNAVVGAASPAVSTGGTFNSGGSIGMNSVFGSTVSSCGGNGGSSVLGGGGGLGRVASQAQGVGGAATVGYGGGGGGSLTSGAAQTGGAGANGVLIIDEYT